MQASANPHFFDELPPEMKLSIVEQVSLLKDYMKLFSVNRNLADIATVAKKYEFFRENYPQLASFNRPMLKLEKLTSSHVRAGRMLVHQAINLLLDWDLLNAEKILRTAMLRYGSSHAMKIIKSMEEPLGWLKIKTQFDELILAYEKQELEVVKAEYESCFTSDKHEQCRLLLSEVDREISSRVIAMVSAIENVFKDNIDNKSPEDVRKNIKEYYSARKFLELASSSATTTIIDQQFSTMFYPKHYMGCIAISNSESAMFWFLKTESHKRFIELEEQLDKVIDKTNCLSLVRGI